MKRFNRFKVLVDQLTDSVVWMTYFPDSTSAPMFDESLGLFRVSGYFEDELLDWYSGFRLFFDHDAGTFVKKGITDSFKHTFENIKLKRAKAIALETIDSTVVYQKEKQAIGQTGIHELLRAANTINSNWLQFYQDEYQCSETEAKKLIEFKIEENNKTEFLLESIRLTAYNKIGKAQTFDEVVEHYEYVCTKLYFVRRPDLRKSPYFNRPF